MAFSNMDMMRINLLVLLFFGAAFLVYQLQYTDAQEEYYEFENIPNDVDETFGDIISAFESDLNVISSMASPGLDPRQVVDEEINDERLEEMRSQNFNGNLEEGIAELKKLTSGFTASASDKDGVDSDEFSDTSNFVHEKFNLSNLNFNENFAETLSILNSIAIIILVIVLKIKLSNKVLVSKAPKK